MNKGRILGIILAFTIIVSFVVLFFVAQNVGETTTEAPDYMITPLVGQSFNLTDLQPKVTIVDFMSVSCTPCKLMNPILININNNVSLSTNIEIISLEVDSLTNKTILENYVTNELITWTVAFAPQGMMESYGVVNLPTFIIIDSEGKITYKKEGLISEEELTEVIQETIEGKREVIRITSFTGFIIAFALITAVSSFFSPCAFPLLPSYMAHILGINQKKKTNEEKVEEKTSEQEEYKPHNVEEKKGSLPFYGLLGLSASTGLLLSYLLFGIVVFLVGSVVREYVGYFLPIIGAVLILLGIAMFTNFTLSFTRIQNWINKKQMNHQKQQQSLKNFHGTFLYGVGYGLASLGCSAPIFFAFTLQALTIEQFGQTILAFIVFIGSIIFLMTGATILIGYSREIILKKMRASTNIIKYISGTIIIIVGIYLILEFFIGG